MPKPLHINFSNVWIFIAKIANSERRSSLRSQCHRNEIFVNCKNDNLCVTKELFFVGDVNLITLVYEKKQKLMLTLLAMHKIAKKKSLAVFCSFYHYSSGRMWQSLSQVPPIFTHFRAALFGLLTGRQQGCSSHAVNSGLCWLCRSPLRDFWTWQSCTTLVSRSPPDTFKDSPCNLHAEQKEAAKSNGTLKATALPKKKWLLLHLACSLHSV